MISKYPSEILILAGFSGSGKSTLARELRDRWNYEFIEHQPLVHEIAGLKGYIRARHWLAKVGTAQFAKESSEAMICKISDAIEKGKTKIVIDVCYGKRMLERFHKKFPTLSLLVVSLISPEITRIRRIKNRLGTNSWEEAVTELRFRDKFLRDVGLNEILSHNGLEIQSIGKPATIANKLIVSLKKRHFTFQNSFFASDTKKLLPGGQLF